MKRHQLGIALASFFLAGLSIPASTQQAGHPSHAHNVPRDADGLPRPSITERPSHDEAPPELRAGGIPILVRPSALAAQISELAGQTVRVPYSRVVGVFNPRVFLIDTATRLPPLVGNRHRVVVLVAPGSLKVAPEAIVASTVTVLGVARTLLGMQVSREVPWPTELRPDVVQRLEIRAAVLANSVRTAEGIELTGR